MFESLFGAEMPLAVRFFLAFLIVLGLIGVTAWAVRRFGAGRLGGANSRGRQPRLAVIDHASVDARRRLILVRRDNVEHLLMIGGPTDVVVESNIVRAMAAPREVGVPRAPSPAEPLPRAIPIPDNGSGSWPLQPETAPAATRSPSPPRIETAPEEPAAWPLQPTADTPKRPQRDTLAALADELSTRPAQPRSRAPVSPRVPLPEPRIEPRAEPHIEPRAEIHAEPRVPAPQPDPAEAAAVDQSLAEMAHRLEAALRKPNAAAEPSQARAPAAPPRAALPAEQTATMPPPLPAVAPAPPRTARPAEPKTTRTDAKPGQGKTLYDSLEQEMASLLGRPPNKT